MRKLTILAVTLAALAAPKAADAQFVLGGRLAYVIPGGDFADGESYDNELKSVFNIQLDAGYVVIPNLTVGLYASYGFGSAGDLEFEPGNPDSSLCNADGVDCSATLWRWGIEGTYAFPMGGWTPWVGLAIGMEYFTLTAEGGGDSIDFKANTWELPVLEAGADFAVGGARVGPYVSWSMGTFDEVKIEGGGQSETVSIDQTASHNYISIGVKGTFGL